MKKSNLLLIMLLVILASFIGCGVKASKVSKGDAKKYADRVTYFKDHRTGLCYAMVAISPDINVPGEQNGVGLACVPCDSVEKLLVNP
jgi:hypothetical protein